MFGTQQLGQPSPRRCATALAAWEKRFRAHARYATGDEPALGTFTVRFDEPARGLHELVGCHARLAELVLVRVDRRERDLELALEIRSRDQLAR